MLLNAKANGRPSITIDNAAGARDVVRHLASLGHEHIAFIGGPPHNVDAEQRRRGFRAGVKTRDLRATECSGDFTEDSGYEAGKKILTLKPPPPAVFAANDSMAIGALSAFRGARVRVPQDMALVGFDDIPIARFLDPPLTTVKVPIAELGQPPAHTHMSWWIWVLLAFALLALELTAATLHIGFFAVGALVVGLLVAFGVEMPLWMELLIFTGVSVFAFLFLRPIAVRKLKLDQKRVVDSLVGETALASEEIAPQGLGRADMRGTTWSARNVGETVLNKGQRCAVVEVEGLVLHVRAS